MSLKDIVIEKKEITVGKVKVPLTGLTLASLVGMLTDYKDEIALLLGDKKGQDALADMATTSPKFIAKLIAMSAGEPDLADKAEQLPLGVQLTAIRYIWELTALDADELGNLLGEVLSTMQAVNLNLPSQKLEAPKG